MMVVKRARTRLSFNGVQFRFNRTGRGGLGCVSIRYGFSYCTTANCITCAHLKRLEHQPVRIVPVADDLAPASYVLTALFLFEPRRKFPSQLTQEFGIARFMKT